MSTLVSIVLANIMVSLISLIGVLTLAFGFMNRKTTSALLVSFAAGVLLATAFLNILPEAFEGIEVFDVLLWTMVGIIIAFLMERFLIWHHHHHQDSHNVNPTSLLVLFGDGVHNFIDGLAIAAAFIVSPSLGIATTIAIAAHEIPQELADYSILVHKGMSRNKALFFNFISALTAIVGGVVGYFIFRESFTLVYYALAITAGFFIYISTADLIPEIHHSSDKSGWINQTVLFLVGILMMYLITISIPHSHSGGDGEHHHDSEHDIFKETQIEKHDH